MMAKVKTYLTLLTSLLLTSCGDLPEYSYDQSEDYCLMSFPFAGGIIGRQYIGRLKVISTLQYLDEDPVYKVIATGPSHIELEAGSFQKLIINEQEFIPKFEKSHLEAELQLWGPAFIFTPEQSIEIYRLMQEGYDMKFLGRIEVGHQYETDMLNFFFESKDEPFRKCINRLLEEEDLIKLGIKQPS